jgi:hypothetical protein
MNFKPYNSEKEIAESMLWPKGTYDFEVLDGIEKVSQSGGNPMIELRLKVFGANGTTRIITDYLLEKRAGKLRHAAETCGLLDRYNTGNLSNSDFRRKRGRLKLGIEKAKDGFPARNTVVDYVAGGGALAVFMVDQRS